MASTLVLTLPTAPNHPPTHPSSILAPTASLPGVNRGPHALTLTPHRHEDDLISFARLRNITILCYAPLAVGAKFGLLSNPAVVAVAAAHGVSPAQAVLKYDLQLTGGVVLPRSTNASHMQVYLRPKYVRSEIPSPLTYDKPTCRSEIPTPLSHDKPNRLENLAVASMTWSLSTAEMASLSSLPQKKIYATSCYPFC